MKKALTLIIVGLLVVGMTGMVCAAEKAPQKIIDLANSTLAAVGTDPVIVKAVKDENAKRKSLTQIQDKDKAWKATPGIADYMQSIMDSECGKHLRSVQDGSPYYAEIFVMDNQGANVAMTDKT